MDLNLHAEQDFNRHLARYILRGEASNVNCLPQPHVKISHSFSDERVLSFYQSKPVLGEHDMTFPGHGCIRSTCSSCRACQW